MKIDKWLLLGVTATTLTVFLLGAWWYVKNQKAAEPVKSEWNAPPLIQTYSPTLGPGNAPVTIVEFLDPECETCRLLYPLVKRAMQDYDGKVRLIVRYMPFHHNSAYAVSVLESARKQGKYWEALEELFKKQPEWASHHAPKPELLIGFMRDLGLDMEKFNNSLTDEEHKAKLSQDQQDGRTLGVTGTPTLFVNGKKLEQLGYAPLKEAIEAALPK